MLKMADFRQSSPDFFLDMSPHIFFADIILDKLLGEKYLCCIRSV